MAPNASGDTSRPCAAIRASRVSRARRRFDSRPTGGSLATYAESVAPTRRRSVVGRPDGGSVNATKGHAARCHRRTVAGRTTMTASSRERVRVASVAISHRFCRRSRGRGDDGARGEESQDGRECVAKQVNRAMLAAHTRVRELSSAKSIQSTRLSSASFARATCSRRRGSFSTPTAACPWLRRDRRYRRGAPKAEESVGRRSEAAGHVRVSNARQRLRAFARNRSGPPEHTPEWQHGATRRRR